MSEDRERRTNELVRLTLAAMAARSGETPGSRAMPDNHPHRWLPPDFPCIDCGAPYEEPPDLKLPVRMLPDGTDWVPAWRLADYRQALVQLLTAAEHQRDVSPGAVPQLIVAIGVAKEALDR